MNDAEGITTMPVSRHALSWISSSMYWFKQVPGRRCPACLERGDTVWVIPGKCCSQCGTRVHWVAFLVRWHSHLVCMWCILLTLIQGRT